eukprot:scaffold49514_cov17-Tisochrysis_lutea.AAC.1
MAWQHTREQAEWHLNQVNAGSGKDGKIVLALEDERVSRKLFIALILQDLINEVSMAARRLHHCPSLLQTILPHFLQGMYPASVSSKALA